MVTPRKWVKIVKKSLAGGLERVFYGSLRTIAKMKQGPSLLAHFFLVRQDNGKLSTPEIGDRKIYWQFEYGIFADCRKEFAFYD